MIWCVGDISTVCYLFGDYPCLDNFMDVTANSSKPKIDTEITSAHTRDVRENSRLNTWAMFMPSLVGAIA